MLHTRHSAQSHMQVSPSNLSGQYLLRIFLCNLLGDLFVTGAGTISRVISWWHFSAQSHRQFLGDMSVCDLFGDLLVASLRETSQAISPQKTRPYRSGECLGHNCAKTCQHKDTTERSVSDIPLIGTPQQNQQGKAQSKPLESCRDSKGSI